MPEAISSDQDYEQLDLLLRGFQVSRILRLVADLEIADKIAPDGVILVADLAAACSVLPKPLLRVLRTLRVSGPPPVPGPLGECWTSR